MPLFNKFFLFFFIVNIVEILNGQTTLSSNSSSSSTSDNASSNQCTNDWSTRTDKNGNIYGYKVIMQDMINYYQARNLCVKEGGEMVSVHSDEEAQFVAKLALPLLVQCQTNNSLCRQRVAVVSQDQMLRSFYIGLNRAAIYPDYDATVVEIWSDGTEVDYASVPTPGVPQTIVPPWGPGSPTGANQTNQQGFPEDCVCIYANSDGASSNWNDISCYHKLGGAICKKQCNGNSGGGSNNGGNICELDGWEMSNDRGYKLIPVPSPGNYWQAIATCLSVGAKVASIHSDQQQAAVAKANQIIQTNCSWIGLHRYALLGGPINNYWDDGSQADYGIVVQPNAGNAPWAAGSPKSQVTNNCTTGNDCTAIVGSSGLWLDQDCISSCGAVICERQCNSSNDLNLSTNGIDNLDSMEGDLID